MGELIERSQEFFMSGEKSWEEMIELKRTIERDAEDKGLEVTRQRGEWHAMAQAKREEEKSNDVVTFSASTIKDLYRDKGFNYPVGVKAYQFCQAFPTDAHMKGLSLNSCLITLPVLKWYEKESGGNKALALRDFHNEFISSLAAGWILAKDNETGLIHRKPLTADDIVAHCKRKRGLSTDTTTKTITQATNTEEAMDNLTPVIDSLGVSKVKAAQLRSALTAELKKREIAIRNTFNTEVETQAIELGKKKASELISYNERKQSELDRELSLASARSKGLPSLITKKEYKFLNQLFFSDNTNVPEEYRDKFNKAFLIIQKLGSGADWK